MDVDAYAKAFEIADIIEGADAVHVTNLRYAIPAIRSRMAGGPPYILTLGYDHAELARLAGKSYKAAMWTILRNWACRWSSGIIVSAHGLEERWQLRKRYPDVPVEIIPNGVPLDRFWVGTHSPHPVPVNIVAVGRLAPEKNLDALISALHEVWPNQSISIPVRLTLVGDGPDRLRLVTLASSLKVAAHFPGKLPYSEVSRVLRQSDIFAMPSWAEGSPKALFEAMACGLPCVVSTGVPDAKRYPCFTHDPGSIGELAASLEMAVAALPGWTGKSVRARMEEKHDMTKNLAREIVFVKSVMP
jgi:glycosyltransferase involved in cell wall biosynthesis